MRKIRLFSIAALALAMAACSSEENTLETQSPAAPGKLHFTATIEAPSTGATTRTEYTEITSGDDAGKINVKWEVGDKIALVHNGVVDEAEVKTVDATGKATIEATITGTPADNDDVTLAYPADAVSSATPSEFFPSFPFAPKLTSIKKLGSQDGTLEFIQNNLDLRMGDGKLAVSGDKATLKESVSIPSIICIWKLTLQDESSNALSATQLKVKYGTSTQAQATSTGKSAYYLAFVPSMLPSGDLTIEATVGSDTYTYTKTGTVSLTAGKYYQSTVKMAKVLTYPVALSAVTADYIGSVVCSDGNVYPAKTAAPSGKTAVGILGKVTSTGQGLILALKDATQQNWNTINGWTSVTTYAGTTLKRLPSAALGTKLTSYTTLGSTTVSNWAVAQKSDYIDIFTNLGSTTGTTDGMTYDANVKAYITTGVGGSAFSGIYWSATEADGSNAWLFGNSWWLGYDKTYYFAVRPVLGF